MWGNIKYYLLLNANIVAEKIANSLFKLVGQITTDFGTTSNNAHIYSFGSTWLRYHKTFKQTNIVHRA